MSVRSKVYVFLLVVALLCGGGYLVNKKYPNLIGSAKAGGKNGDSKKAGKNGKKGEEDESIPIQVSKAIRGDISSYIASTANLRALREVDLLARAEGVVRRVASEEGDYVKRGQLLCLLDDRELQINLDLTKQRLEQSKVQLESAKILREKNASQVAAKKNDLERNEEALGEGLVSDTDVDLLRNQLAELIHDGRVQAASVRENEYRVEELTSEIESVELQISHTRVTAPFAGRITERTVELGATVRNNDTLFKLAAFTPLFADVFISDADSRRVSRGQEVAIGLGADGEETTQGKIVRVSPTVDGSTGTVKVTAEFNGAPSRFRPGAFVRVQIRTDTVEDAVLIPKVAVIEEEGETYVYVADGETARKKTVELGYEDGVSVQVRSGVSIGEQIIVAGQGALKDGDKTRTVS